MTDEPKISLSPSGREKIRLTSEGVTIHYTYADEDPGEIPKGQRRATFLEPDPHPPAPENTDD